MLRESAAKFRETHGDVAYELDGLPAAVLQSILRSAIEPLIDWAARDRVLANEDRDRVNLREIIHLAQGEELL